MQDYEALNITATPCNEDITDLLAAFLGEIGYESFTADENGMTAYIRAIDFSESALKEVLSDFPISTKIEYTHETVEGKDWNEEWEKNYFKPIVIGEECVVHSSFHTDIPEARYDIVIDPKMAFGTGHHSTTSGMIRHILTHDMKDKAVIDMGTGTGILAILCKMKGAGSVTGIEIDPFACENAVENGKLNNVDVDFICGDASALAGSKPADVFFANINRNVITSDIESYARALKPGGEMYLSGFYEEDIPIVTEAASPYGLTMTDKLVDKDWAAIRLVKND